MDIEKIISSELDFDPNKEDRLRVTSKIVIATAIAMSLFHIYTAIFGLFDFITQRGVHMAFGVTLIALQAPFISNIFKGRLAQNPVLVKIFLVIDVIMILAMWGGVIISHWEYQQRILSAGSTSTIAMIAGFMMLVVVLEVSRRKLGLLLPIISIVFIVYAWAGPYLPFVIMHRGYSFSTIFAFLAANPDGLFGVTMSVSATVIFMFILFGAFLEASGTNDVINNFATALTGRFKAGPALSAVFASALMGTINGSAVANVVGTGTFTIPLMKRQGYKAEFAGAVEAAASTGGQILPPVMGAGAFIMVVFTEIPYTKSQLQN